MTYKRFIWKLWYFIYKLINNGYQHAPMCYLKNLRVFILGFVMDSCYVTPNNNCKIMHGDIEQGGIAR